MGRDLRLENLTKRYGHLTAVDHVDLEIREGEFICFLGPSGCGKTTVLRMITGFETVTEGKVIFDNRVINDLLPKKREFGIVFQSYALFPNMTVEENIAFGLKMRKMPKKVIAERVDVMLDLIGLSGWRRLYPAQLSGGQQQRVALVRALAPDPQVLLLDEPLSALDAKIRLRLRAEIKRLQQELKKTMIHVTHDQEEALSIADRVVVMEGGQFRQVGRPIDIYKNPTCSFVADFVGTSNFFKGSRTGDVFKKEAPPRVDEPMNLVSGRIEVVVFQGAAVRLLINIDGEEIIADINEKEFGQRSLKRGDEIYLYFPPEAFLVFADGEGGK
jgi:iron(III) transport system ATP-binding protein